MNQTTQNHFFEHPTGTHQHKIGKILGFLFGKLTSSGILHQQKIFQAPYRHLPLKNGFFCW